MTIIKALILGLIQGVSEFLPISSSGHLSIAGRLMGFDPEADSLLSFNILLHVATLAAVFIVYRNDIWEMIKAFFGMCKDLFTGKGLRLKEFLYRRLIVMLIVATLPATVAAFVLGDIIENPELWQIGIFLIITAILLFLSEKLAGGNTDLEKMFKDTFNELGIESKTNGCIHNPVGDCDSTPMTRGGIKSVTFAAQNPMLTW